MEFNDNIGKFKGHIIMQERKKGTRDWKTVQEIDNVYSTVGKEIVMNFLQSGTGVYINHFGVGSGATAESTGDTDLEYPNDITSAAEPHKVFELITNNGKSLQFDAELTTTEPAVQPVNLTEIALFSAISGGSCFARATHTGYTKSNLVELRYQYTVSLV